MRVYFEKPRTSIGWKGLINDPHLDGSGDVNAGLRMARALLLQILDTGLPIGCEFLDPITPQYISDAVAWGAIGARTTESQIHRQLGSGLSMPIGFKNRTDGNVQVAVDAVRAAAASHAFAGIDDSGIPAIHHTTGNPDGHVILRGGKGAPNYDDAGVEDALAKLRAEGLPERVVIDASHDNSGKDPARQIVAAGEIGEQIAAGNEAIVGIMLESFIVEGNQSSDGDGPLIYGQSITDACIAWEDTVSVLDGLARGGQGAARRDEDRVLGVGLIGGSIGRAARARIDGADGRRLRPGPRDAGARGRRRRRSTAPRPRSPRPARAPRSSSARRRWRPRRARSRRRSPPAARTSSSPTSARPSASIVAALGDDERFIGGHPLAGAETAGRRQRPRRPLRGRPLVPDPDRATPAASSTTACSGSSPASAPARRRSTPRPTTG